MAMACAGALSSMAAATTGLLPRVPTSQSSRCLALPHLPPRPFAPTLRNHCKNFSDSKRFSSFQVKASSTEETSIEDLLADLKEKWDKLENKSTVLLYGGGAIVAVWLSSVVVSAINSVPLLPKIMELVGLGYTGWFVYRYLLFKSGRKELAEDIEQLKKKIAGSE
uniref:Cyanobacterial aminoacyl-tRNA synthetase CAAD domain-containing protein n=1 Tax=Opuntia streptacantha TaxID=393608 RepID=A0A7C9CXM1_OPUST